MKACVIGLAGHLILTFSANIPMKPCCYGFSLVLAFLSLAVFSSFSSARIFYRGKLVFHGSDSFVLFVVSVIAFIFHLPNLAQAADNVNGGHQLCYIANPAFAGAQNHANMQIKLSSAA